jgi:TRAP-type mannitol/chloroaromatic compound transport system substrate-binding protein
LLIATGGRACNRGEDDMRSACLLAMVGLLLACGGERPAAVARGMAAPAEVIHWKLVTTWPKNLPALGVAPENLAKRVDLMSNGRLKIKVYGAGELVPAFGVFDAVSQGTAQMGHGASYYWRGKIPVAAVFSTVPFGMTAQEMNGWLLFGGGMELWRELYAPFNLVPFVSGNTGVQMAGWFNKEVNSLADIKGLKMRIPGLGGEVFQRAGGVAVSMPASEMFTALQTGAIDATEWVGPYNDLALGLYTVAKYYYYPGWHEPGPALEAIVNKDAWESLSPDLRAIVETASLAINDEMLAEFTARNNSALKSLIEDHGVQLRRLPDDVLAEFKRLSVPVIDELAGSSEIAGRIVASYRQFQRDVSSYHKISEQAYIEAR